jgi:transitional endoplasmic reticulum ATPase
MGLPRKPRTASQGLTGYRLDCLNPDEDLVAIAEGLRQDPRGRLCLYGPPGTGKTAFGEHIARTLDRPLLIKRASDLLSMWVGETEKRIARMFGEAERANAVLLLDEADSFLRDRSGSHYSWEVTQVNELLTQMEGFDGLFIAATNLIDTLDGASLRRFDLKVRFDYLRPEQAERLFVQVLAEQGAPTDLDEEFRDRLAQLDRLAPGDFATVIRRFRITREPWTSAGLLEGLRAEYRAKPESRQRPMGFAASL